MNSKKFTLIIVVIILLVTAALFSLKFAQKNAQAPDVAQTPGVKNLSQGAKNSADSSTIKSVTSADPDAKALEEDLNSISEEDFSDSSLSDSAVGL